MLQSRFVIWQEEHVSHEAFGQACGRVWIAFHPTQAVMEMRALLVNWCLEGPRAYTAMRMVYWSNIVAHLGDHLWVP